MNEFKKKVNSKNLNWDSDFFFCFEGINIL